MDCDEIRPLLHPYVDGELDLVTSLKIERHLQTCAACAQEDGNYRALRAGFREGTLSFAAPATLENRLRASVRQTGRAHSLSFALTPRLWWGAAVSLAFLAVLGVSLLRHLPTRPADSLLTQEVVSSHVRSLMGAHLADVISTDQHTVKPWFNGKLDYSPPVTDFAKQGFPLLGGRLDYLDNRPVAALVYRRQKHLINVFVWPSASAAPKASESAATRQGYHVLHWTQAGMTYWAVSDLNTIELRQLMQLLKNENSLEPPSPSAQGP